MHTCKVCLKVFDKPESTRGYTSYCSTRCYASNWNKNNRDKARGHQKTMWRSRVKESGCVICGFKRAVDKAHIIWKKDGGKVNKENIVILCPNHHRLFDQGKLTKVELLKIKPISNA